MLNLDHLSQTLPPLPSLSGKWVSVYLEPMLGSGERLTIIVAAVASNGDILVKPAIRKEVVEAMYGFRASSFNNMVELITNSLKSHLELIGEFPGWHPPISGISVGMPRDAASSTTTGILRQAVSLSSSLSSLLDTNLDEEGKVKKTREKDRWSTQLIDAVLREDARRECFFNRQFSFSDGHRPAKIFYLSDNAAINTGKLLPSNLNEFVKDGKAKISDLSMIKKHDNLFRHNNHQMIVFRPTDDDPAYSDKNIMSIQSAYLALEDLANTYDVAITPVHSVEHAARIILKTAA
jgi:hypothetical protein